MYMYMYNHIQLSCNHNVMQFSQKRYCCPINHIQLLSCNHMYMYMYNVHVRIYM